MRNSYDFEFGRFSGFVMFTPQKKVWSDWSLSARRGGAGSGRGVGSDSDGLTVNPSDGKGKKSIVVAEPATPPLDSNGIAIDGDDLAEKVSQLEKEVSGNFQSNVSR